MVISVVVLACCGQLVSAQSRDQAVRLHDEALKLQETARSREDQKRAVEKFEQALNIYIRVGDKRGTGVVLNSLGLLFYDWGEHQKAVEFYMKSLEICRNAGEMQCQGDALINLGIVHMYWGQHQKAVELYDKALQIRRKLGDQRKVGHTLVNLGIVYGNLGQYQKAAESYDKALQILRKVGDVPSEGRTLQNLAFVFMAWGQYQKAEESYNKGLQIFRKGGDVQAEGRTLTALGGVYAACGQYQKAVGYYEQALQICSRLGDIRTQGQTLTALGMMYAVWGQYQKAVEFYEKSMTIYKKTQDQQSEGQTLHHLGIVYAAWGQYQKAAQYYDKALAYCRKVGDVPTEGATVLDMGKVQVQAGDYDAALASFQKGLDIRIKIGEPVWMPQKLIGDLYLERGEMEKAERLLKEANNLSSLGRLYLAKSELAAAKDHYGRLLKSAETSRNADDLFTARTGLGLVHEQLRDDSQAAEYYRKAIDLTEELRACLSQVEREHFFDVKVEGFRRTAPYEGLARVLVRMKRPVEALRESEHTKARIFAETLSRRIKGAAVGVPMDILKKDAALNEQVAALTRNLQKGYEKGNKEVIGVLEPQVKQAKKIFTVHVDMLRKKYPLFAATKYPLPMEIEQAALKVNEWVLAYDVTDTGLIIYLTNGKNLIKGLFKPIPRKEVDALVRILRKSMEVAPDDSVLDKLQGFNLATSEKLADLLVGDVLAEIPKDAPLIVVPDDSLGVLPFELLVLNKSGKNATDRTIPYVTGAEFLGDRNPISYYQSITALTLVRAFGKGKTAAKKTLVMADPVFQLNDARAQRQRSETKVAGVEGRFYRELMAAVEEGKLGGVSFSRLSLTRDLVSDFQKSNKDDCDVYAGLDMSKEIFLNRIAPRLRDYDKIVFATHGYFGKGLPGINEPVLVFTLVPPGTDGYLRMSEVMGLNMNADIAALTACQTGLGREISGEGTMGMGRAFQHAGARSVLMSLWSVEEESSVHLVGSFFKHMKEGKGKIESLKLARDEIRKAGFDHPFFWASFILVGEAQ